MGDPEIRNLLGELSASTLCDLCAAYSISVPIERELMIQALLRSPATAEEIVQDLLTDAEATQLARRMHLVAQGASARGATLSSLEARRPRLTRSEAATRGRWSRADRVVSLLFLGLAILAPFFAPLYYAANAGRIGARVEHLELRTEQVARFERGDLDSWGRPFRRAIGFMYSAGPNGRYELGAGDDLRLPGSSWAPAEHLQVAIYLWAPWNVLGLLALVWGTYAFARLTARDRGLAEVLTSGLVAMPLTGAFACLLVRYWGTLAIARSLRGGLIVPTRIAAVVSFAFLVTLSVYALRRFRYRASVEVLTWIPEFESQTARREASG